MTQTPDPHNLNDVDDIVQRAMSSVTPSAMPSGHRTRRRAPFLRTRNGALLLFLTLGVSTVGGTAALASATVLRTSNPQPSPPIAAAIATPAPSAAATHRATPRTTPSHVSARTPDATPPLVARATPAPTPTLQTPPAPTAPRITDLVLTPSTLVNNGSNSTKIKFTLDSDASVTIDILDASGSVACQALTNDQKAAGVRSQPYFGFDGHSHLLPPGTYTVRVAATANGVTGFATATLVLSSH